MCIERCPHGSGGSVYAALTSRAVRVHSGTVDARTGNMLKITSDGRKLGLDQRIINPILPDEPGAKVNECIANTLPPEAIYYDRNQDKLPVHGASAP